MWCKRKFYGTLHVSSYFSLGHENKFTVEYFRSLCLFEKGLVKIILHDECLPFRKRRRVRELVLPSVNKKIFNR